MVDVKELKKGNYIVWEGEPCIIKELQIDPSAGGQVHLALEGLFSGKSIEAAVALKETFQEAEIIRKCATIITKAKKKLQIMDMVTFETIDAEIDEDLLQQATENDQVTYIRFGKTTKVLEVRKH